MRSYRIVGLLGAGGFGKVYRATLQGPHGFQKEVAIKRLLTVPDANAAAEFERRLRDEARLLAMLKHRNIIVVDMLTRLDGDWCVVMELLPGVDLLDLLTRTGPLPERAALEATAEIAAALAYAWDAPGPDGTPLRLKHRDIKPQNVMLCEDGALKVLDFGIARAEFAGREANTRDIAFGTPSYMAPERRVFDASDTEDCYSVVGVLYHLLAGEVVGDAQPHEAAHEAVIRAGLRRLERARPTRPELLDLLRVGFAHEPDARRGASLLAARCRELARDADGEDLLTLAARVVAKLRADRARRAPPSDPEIGRVYPEQTQDTIPVSGPIDPFPTGATALGALAFPSVPHAPPVASEPWPLMPSSPVPMSMTEAQTERPPTPSESFRARVLGASIGLSAVVGAAAVAAGLVMLTGGLNAAPPAVPTPAITLPPESPAPDPSPPAPEATPSTAPPAAPARRVSVTLSAADRAVELRGPGVAYTLPGRVPPGTYTAYTDFGGGLEAAGSVSVRSGGQVTITCSEVFHTCEVSAP